MKYMADCPVHFSQDEANGEIIEFDQRAWYRIENYDAMPAFFMTITNPDNLWMFISSSGGLTAGRINKDHALLPYTTDDKITESTAHSGPISRFIVTRSGKQQIWEAFSQSIHRSYSIKRNLYKSELGDSLIFEEENESLGLRYRVSWEMSPGFGIHRRCTLENTADSAVEIRVYDGIRNILPAGVTSQTQEAYSNLLDAYKRSEVAAPQKLGIYALSATLTDMAEPSESMMANTVWTYGLEDGKLLISDSQNEAFLRGAQIHDERDAKGQRGAAILHGAVSLEPAQKEIWGFVAEVDQDHCDIVALRSRLANEKDNLVSEVLEDIGKAQKQLWDILDRHDGMQSVGSPESSMHHKANVLFNLMRGGYFQDGNRIDRDSFLDFTQSWNRPVWEASAGTVESALPPEIGVEELRRFGRESGSPDLERMSYEYLPLTFSRRHGDPSRPWNQFSIRTRDRDGNALIGYQGNWRDIFQNWEALCMAEPEYFPSVIVKFLNATTIDGYNPYRISEHGVDWEIPEPDNPWSNIGYWSDHQIVYLSRLLEHCANYLPKELETLAGMESFVFADVPYRIADYAKLLENPYDSIHFDIERHEQLAELSEEIGADGRLLRDGSSGELHRAGFSEKLLILFLAKLANYVPGGGIWMNTQRPEWNDANNALAGWGLSMVTLSYLINYLHIFRGILEKTRAIELNGSTADWLEASMETISSRGEKAIGDPAERKKLMDDLGLAAERYRRHSYAGEFGKGKRKIDANTMSDFFAVCIDQFDKTVEGLLRDDGSFESYLVLKISGNDAEVLPLYPMLEGQVAGLSIKNQDPERVLSVLESLRNGPLYREDQHSYLLYPNRELPLFLEKNSVATDKLGELFSKDELSAIPSEILSRDIAGTWHFNGHYRNVKGLLKDAADLAPSIREKLASLYEETFNHREFTGRSGTFFAFEGLGSIYWHMVSKLLLAVQEQLIAAVDAGEDRQLIASIKEGYLDVRKGIGFMKGPAKYGAFPTDPYSHSPWGKGAKQPGMTGQVKEEVVARYAELGAVVEEGRIRFIPELILADQWRQDGSLEFSLCGVPVRIQQGDDNSTVVIPSGGKPAVTCDRDIDAELSAAVFRRNGEIESIRVEVDRKALI